MESRFLKTISKYIEEDGLKKLTLSIKKMKLKPPDNRVVIARKKPAFSGFYKDKDLSCQPFYKRPSLIKPRNHE